MRLVEWLQKHAWPWLGALAGSVAVLLPLSPLYRNQPGADQSVYLYVARQMLSGGAPYLTAWDHKQPLAYALYALGLLISPDALWGIWLIECALLAAAVWAGWQTLRLYVSPWVAAVAVGLALLALWPVLWSYSVEELTLAFQALTLWCVLRGLRARRGWGWALAVGALTGVCFFLKQNLAAAGAAAGLLTLLWPGLSWRRKSGDLLAMAAGFGAASGAVLAWLASLGALGAYRAAAFDFNLIYSNLGLAERFSSLLDSLEFLGGQPGLFVGWAAFLAACALGVAALGAPLAAGLRDRRAQWALALVGAGLATASLGMEFVGGEPGFGLAQRLALGGGLAVLILGGWRAGREKLAAGLSRAAAALTDAKALAAPLGLGVAGYALALALLSFSGRNYVYYYIPLYPFHVLLFGGVAGWLLAGRERLAAGLALGGLAAAMVYAPLLTLVSAYGAPTHPPLPEVVNYVLDHTQPDDAILAWGKESTYVYFLARRQAPGRYFYQAPINEAAYNDLYGVADEVAADLRREKPALFLDSANTDPRLTSGDLNACLAGAQEQGPAAPVFAEVCEAYDYVGMQAEFRVYHLKK